MNSASPGLSLLLPARFELGSQCKVLIDQLIFTARLVSNVISLPVASHYRCSMRAQPDGCTSNGLALQQLVGLRNDGSNHGSGIVVFTT